LEGNAYLSELAAGIIYLLAGVRLVSLGIRTGESPERLLGASFIMYGVSSIIYAFAAFESLSTFWTPLNFAARLIYLPSAVLVAVFTARVFRPNDRWARWLVRGNAALLVAGVGGSALTGDWDGFSLSNPYFWLEWLGYTLPFAWAAAEALHQYVQARRRVRVGLCEPSVCNRMFLWSLFGLIQALSAFVVIGQYAAYERENVFSSTWDFLYGGTILAALIVIWFAFFPLAFYTRWIDRSTHRSASEQV
jgi:hypothetical protein